MKSFLESKYLDHGVAAVLWLTVFFVYTQTIARTVGFIDSGELATVPYVLGIAHPTGYPLWTLATHIFSHLPIAHEEIVRLNIFCALATSSAVVLLFYAMLLLFRSGMKIEDPVPFNYPRCLFGTCPGIFPNILGPSDIDRSVCFPPFFTERHASIFSSCSL